MKKGLLLLLMTMAIWSCSKDSDDTPQVKLSNLKEMTSFRITVEGKSYEAEIKDNFIQAVLPSSTDLTKLSPEIKISEKAKVTPNSGVVQDFTKTVEYIVMAEDKSTKVYKAVITKTNSQKAIESFAFVNLPEGASSYVWKNKNPLDMDTLVCKVPYLSNIKALTSKITVSSKATIDPASGTTLDYSKPVKYTVKAEDGSKAEYLVIVDNSIEQVKFSNITRDGFRSKKTNDVIVLQTNALSPVKENNKVKLRFSKGTTVFDLKVTNIDYKTNQISVALPAGFENNEYVLSLEIEKNNSVTSIPFVLDGGSINFQNVADVLDPYTGNYVVCNRLLMPGERFRANIYLEHAKFSTYKFFLRKDGRDFALLNPRLNSTLEQVEFVMPNLPNPAVKSGSDFELVVKDANNKEVGGNRLVNTKKSNISVIVAEAPIVKSLSKTKVKEGDQVIIFGENIFYNYAEIGSGVLTKSSTVRLTLNGNMRNIELTGVSSNAGSFSTKGMDTGTYKVEVTNNIPSLGASKQEITLIVESSTTPISVKVDSAEIHSDKNPYFAQQILVSFNESIEDYDIKEFRISSNSTSYIVDNYIRNKYGVSTPKLPSDKYNVFYNNSTTGYVILVDKNNKEHKLSFTVSKAK